MNPISRAAALQQDIPARLVGICLLLATLDPARVSAEYGERWIASAVAVALGALAAPPVRQRPALSGYRLKSRISRNRNTLLPCAAVVLAASTSPSAWLMALDLALLLAYLSLLDLTGQAPGAPRSLGSHALAATAAAGLVLAASLAPATGGWWGRLVAATVVLLVCALMYALLRLRKPASYTSPTSPTSDTGRRH
jgi:hypothetical protein